MRRLAAAVLLACSLPLTGCRIHVDLAGRAPDLATRRHELEAAQQEAIRRAAAGDVIGAIADAMAPTGAYGAALRAQLGTGPAAARRFLERDTLNAKSRGRWVVVRLDVSADGNDGYSFGYLDFVRPNGDTLPGGFKSYWRREADGRWRMLAFGRGPRTPGALTSMPDSLRTATRSPRRWPMTDTLEAWRGLAATERAFSDLAATDVRVAFMAYAAPDGGRLDGAGYVFGRWAIGEGFRTPPPGFAGFSWSAERGSVAKSNDLGFNLGPVLLNAPNGGAPQPGGMFFTIWRREANGEWRWIVD
jgi:ketosteroid isomerase-like protein